MPVTEPMYYDANNKCLEKTKEKVCYLPAGADWYDYWSGAIYKGGQDIIADTPIDITPLFIKAGSILPVANDLQYADQPTKGALEILVYPGSDTSFVLYEDVKVIIIIMKMELFQPLNLNGKKVIKS